MRSLDRESDKDTSIARNYASQLLTLTDYATHRGASAPLWITALRGATSKVMQLRVCLIRETSVRTRRQASSYAHDSLTCLA